MQGRRKNKGNARATRAIFDVYVHHSERRRNSASNTAVTRRVLFIYVGLLLHSDQAFGIWRCEKQFESRANTMATQMERATQRQHKHKGNARATRQHLILLIENGQAIHSDQAFWGHGDANKNLNQGQHKGQHKGDTNSKGDTKATPAQRKCKGNKSNI